MTDIRGITIRTEEPKDYRTTENLTREAFWNVYRPGCMEHYVLHCFRSDPAYKRQGYGKILLDYSMEKARAMGVGALTITGNIAFYGKSGFVPAKTRGVRYADDPEATYFLIRELKEGFLNGVSGSYRDPMGYFFCENNPEAFEKFEATFPPPKKAEASGAAV